uniref:Uncharacterized protein n=1 Tax=Candidatus Kentrum eta TaxID=2126337 RepID=A0A450UPN7_9GAMM|nr:MAG: hypothetical protein BECKH772A_GA0070896_1006119 [Candidatus Kentron sp. H]VFJ94513.1 MAG: hypothetical protein BECKH772B_GA0070898_1006219 [Candidatus Kentron sp. H]VFK01002.1 MAG: hypothetical protein BECKH772C_GA0070978_1005619 [Candidatus Kentron sp. H]
MNGHLEGAWPMGYPDSNVVSPYIAGISNKVAKKFSWAFWIPAVSDWEAPDSFCIQIIRSRP